MRHLAVVIVCLLILLPRADAQQWTFPAGEEPTSSPFDCVLSLSIPEPWGAEDAAQIALCMQDARNYYYAEFLGGGVWIGRCEDGRRSALAGKAQLTSGDHEIAIQRRARRLQLVIDGRRVLTAYDDALGEGKTAVATSGGVAVEDLIVQPIGEVYMDDDFTRTPGEMGVWEALSGEWETSGEEREKPELSANPFALQVEAEARALASAGYDFWEGYRFRCAVKPSGNGAVGLAAYFQDPDNYYLLRWSRTGAVHAEAGGRLQLVRAVDGRWRVLAEEIDCPYRLDTWYDLALQVADGSLEAYVDGRLRLSASDDTFVRGRVALYAETCESAFFDDAKIRSRERYQELFASSRVLEGRCRPMRGRWSVDAEHLYGQAREGRAAIALTGERSWEDYAVEASVKLKEAQRVGLVLCYQGPGDYYLVRWGTTGGGQGARELIRVANGKEQALATATFTCVRNRFERVRVACHRGHITFSADDRLVLEAADATLDRGAVGFYVEGRVPGCFDDVDVRFHEPPPPPPDITDQFTKEDTMTSWAAPGACWRGLGDDRFVYSLPLFADYRVDVQLQKLAEEQGRLDLHLGADEQLGGGARLRASCEDGALTTELFVGDRALARGQMRSDDAAPTLVVEQHGNAVMASLQEEAGTSVILAHQVGGALSGRFVGFARGGLSPGRAQIAVRSPGLVDHTFSGAPTGWRPGQGAWKVHDRWPCFPGWSWFGGRDPEGQPKNPLIWCKDRFSGELAMEVWSALIMDLPAAPGYSDPSDLNCTICADGSNLCSGYSFVYAGDQNSVAKIMRGNETVAQTDVGVFDNPISSNADFHRHWFKARIHKRGGHIRYFMDDELLLEYHDDTPLSGDNIAIWSYNNGILVSRVRISAEHRTRR